MKNVSISPSTLCGIINAPPSKSAYHRALICAAFANGKSVIKAPIGEDSMDIRSTKNALRSLGANIVDVGEYTFVERHSTPHLAEIDCNESGSTLRFLLPVAAALGIKTRFTGCGRLPFRPINELVNLLENNGIHCSSSHLPLEIRGKLGNNNLSVSANISSQYVSGLLFAAAVMNKKTFITLTTSLQSASYVDMTINELRHFGVSIERLPGGYLIDSTRGLSSCNREIEGDWSQAAFFLTAAAIGGKITVNGLLDNSHQGDRVIVDLLAKFGATVTCSQGTVMVENAPLHGITIDASDIPDLVPILAVCAAFACGTTTIHSADRLRLKESDRLYETAKRLSLMGVNINERSGGLTIIGDKRPLGIETDSANDHRIVMAFTIAAAFSNGNSLISNCDVVNKSYPQFFNDYKSLGGIANVF